jgi:signal peptidase I
MGQNMVGRTRLRVIIGFMIIGLGLWVLLQRHLDNLDYLVVTSESMEPTLRIGDRLVMERPRDYHAGDIVVFEEPGNPSLLVVKRIIGMPGNLVIAEGDNLTIHPTSAPSRANSGNSWLVKPGELFVAGDNRPVSRDSREYGPIALESVRGTVRYRIRSRLHWEQVK